MNRVWNPATAHLNDQYCIPDTLNRVRVQNVKYEYDQYQNLFHEYEAEIENRTSNSDRHPPSTARNNSHDRI